MPLYSLQLDALTRQLATAHAPLALLALGITLDTQPPQARQVIEQGPDPDDTSPGGGKQLEPCVGAMFARGPSMVQQCKQLGVLASVWTVDRQWPACLCSISLLAAGSQAVLCAAAVATGTGTVGQPPDPTCHAPMPAPHTLLCS
jgi:hypothetical protein